MRHYIKYALCLLLTGAVFLSGCHTTPDSDSSQAGNTTNAVRMTGTTTIGKASSDENTTETTIISSGSSIRTSVPSTGNSSTRTIGTVGVTTAMGTSAISPVLPKEDEVIAARLGLCVSETNMSNDSVGKKLNRYKMLKSDGVTAARVAVGWPQPAEDSWQPSNLTDVGIAVESGLRIKLICSTIMNPPSWIFQKYGNEARMVNQDGVHSHNNCLSYWMEGIEKLTGAAVDHIFADLKAEGLLDQVDAVVVDLGAAGEPIYPPAWTQVADGLNGGGGEDKMWCYSSDAQEDFRKTMKEKYGTIAAADKAWGKNYSSFEAVSVPKPDGSAAGQMWEDVLVWYRDTKRGFIEKQIRVYQQTVNKYTRGRVKLILYLPGSDITDAQWDEAVKTGTAPSNVRIMCDNRFVMDMAKKYGCWLQYTGVNDAGQAAYIRKYMDDTGIANTPIFGENAGNYGAAKDPVALASTIIRNGYFGIDYTHTIHLFESDRSTKSDIYPKFVAALKTLRPYLEKKAAG